MEVTAQSETHANINMGLSRAVWTLKRQFLRVRLIVVLVAAWNCLYRTKLQSKMVHEYALRCAKQSAINNIHKKSQTPACTTKTERAIVRYLLQ